MHGKALLIVVFATVLTAGCIGAFSGSGDDPVREQQAENLLETAQDTLAAADSYEAEATAAVTVSATGESEQIVSGTERVNLTDRTGVYSVSGPDVSGDVYIDDRTMYAECPDPWGGWGQETIPEDATWTDEATTVGSMLSLLETGDLHYNGTELRDGTEAVVLVGSPDVTAADSVGGTAGPDIPSEANIEDATLRMWIDTETDRPIASVYEVTVTADDETATATLRTEALGYDQPVSVSVPREATADPRVGGCPGA